MPSFSQTQGFTAEPNIALFYHFQKLRSEDIHQDDVAFVKKIEKDEDKYKKQKPPVTIRAASFP